MKPEILINETQLDDIRARLGAAEKEAPKLLARAMKRGLIRMWSLTTKAIAKEVGIKQKTAKTRVWKGWSGSNLRGRIRVGRVGLSYIDLSPRRTNKGVSIRWKGRRETVEGGFLAIPQSSRRVQVFKRAMKKRLPIIVQRTPALADIARAAGIPEAVILDGQMTISKEIDRQIQLVLERGGLPTGGTT